MAVTDASGHGRAFGAKGSAPISLGDRDYVKAALKTRDLVIGAPVMARVTKHLAIPFARSVFVKGKIAGAVTAAIDIDAFSFGYTKTTSGSAASSKSSARTIGSSAPAFPPTTRRRVSSAGRSAGRMSPGSSRTRAMRARTRCAVRSTTRSASSRTGVSPAIRRRHRGLAYDDIAEQTEGIRRMVIITAAAATIIILIFLLAWMHQVSVRKQLRALQIQEAQAKEEALEATKAALSATAAKSEFLANMSHDPHADERRDRPDASRPDDGAHAETARLPE